MDMMERPDELFEKYLFSLLGERAGAMRDDGLFHALRVTDIGYFPHAGYHRCTRESGCDAAIVLYCHSGQGYVRIGREAGLALRPGQAVLIPPHTAHSYGALPEDPWSVYWAHFSGDSLPAYFAMVGGSAPLPVSSQLDGDILREFHRCFKLLEGPCQAQEYYLVCQSVGSVLAMLAAAGRLCARKLDEQGEGAVERCIWHMRANVAKPLGLAELAAISGYSPSHLNVLFRRATGCAPVEYFLRMKMQAAAKDLAFTKRSVKQIAADFGMEDPHYFSRLFKKVMGASPQAYRGRAVG